MMDEARSPVAYRSPSVGFGANSGSPSGDRSGGGIDGLDMTPSRRSGFGDETGRSSNNSPGGMMNQSQQTQRRVTRLDNSHYSHGSSKRKIDKEPHLGYQAPVRNVFDILKQTRLIISNIQNVWGWTNHTTTFFRLRLPGLCRVHVGQDVYILQGYLLQDTSVTGGFSTTQSSFSSLSHTTVTDPTVQEVYVQHHTTYFPHIILLLKLRWLIRLHSACCELDYKMCSLKNLIMGLQYVVLQQHAEAEADSGFENKVVQHIGSHINLESVLDDFTDQLQRALGKSWRSFLEFVSTCDPGRSVHTSQMDMSKKPLVVSNDTLAAVIDTIFISHFLRQPFIAGSGRLRELYDDLEMLGIPAPELPALRGAANLRAWAVARSKPTRKDREKGGGKAMEKLAQVDFVALTCAVELHEPEVMASEEEIQEHLKAGGVTVSADKTPGGAQDKTPGGTLPQISEIGIGEKPGSAGPPAARVILEEKPHITAAIFEGAVAACSHHMTFPDGIRERLYTILCDEYGLTEAQSERLGIATAQNIDGQRLPEQRLLEMGHREKVRLRFHEAKTNKDCSHLLVSSLVGSHSEKGQPAKYCVPPPVLPRSGLPGSAFGAVDMTRSLPNLRSFRASNTFGREEFKVPLSTGPLTMDPDLHKLRTTGYFIKMPPLKFT
jgi:hypothetical protein